MCACEKIHCQVENPWLSYLWILFCFALLFRASPVAYGNSQARGRISYRGWPTPGVTATAMPGQIRVCNLHSSSQQHQILNPLSKARDGTCIFMDPSRIHFHWAPTGRPDYHILGNDWSLLWINMGEEYILFSCITVLKKKKTTQKEKFSELLNVCGKDETASNGQ